MATPNESKFKVVSIAHEVVIALYGGEHLSTVITLHPLEAEQLSRDLADIVTELVGRSPTMELFDLPRDEKEGGR